MEDLDLRSMEEARRLLEAASAAAPRLAALSQESIDGIVDAIHLAAVPRAEAWARLAHEETGFGNVADKTAKNLFAAVDVYRFIRPMTTVGVLAEDHERRVIEIAAPAGIVAAIIPSTNPTSTAINKILIAMKAACPIVLSPHPSARRCVIEVAGVLGQAATAAGAPPGSIGCMSQVALEGTRELMRHPLTAIILATGGTGLVRAAYSSGKPAYGVGPGNVPAYVDRSADVAKAARDIVAGKTFDNGVLCSAENAVVADAPIAEALRKAMTDAGCLFLDDAAAERLSRLVVTPSGSLNPEIVGRDARTIAGKAGIDSPEGTRALVVTLRQVGPSAPLSREKLSPILAFYVEDGWEAACARCLEILAYGGMGHTMAVHARDRDVIMRFGLTKPVFRIVVNTPSATGAVGITTGVHPSLTLGCGALGGNITSDNITPRHLINVRRLAFEIRGRPPETAGPPRSSAPAPVEIPPPAAAAPPPAAAPSGPERAGLRERVAAILRMRELPGRPSGTPPARPVPAATPPAGAGTAPVRAEPPGPDAPRPAAFVCEADVRQAIEENRKIIVSQRSIITPAARDMGTAHRVFIEI